MPAPPSIDFTGIRPPLSRAAKKPRLLWRSPGPSELARGRAPPPSAWLAGRTRAGAGRSAGVCVCVPRSRPGRALRWREGLRWVTSWPALTYVPSLTDQWPTDRHAKSGVAGYRQDEGAGEVITMRKVETIMLQMEITIMLFTSALKPDKKYTVARDLNRSKFAVQEFSYLNVQLLNAHLSERIWSDSIRSASDTISHWTMQLSVFSYPRHFFTADLPLIPHINIVLY
ncbi:hypothetical protein RRG08_028865 [Elysia crispata]|uniref:Uncharacterized protein n=1 Tax=Elysia crispata TaxID=231223 RepID=A0AAE0YZ10_9GAST|nr:hypothetical protein RRG08_028865 [Elysia crispata]